MINRCVQEQLYTILDDYIHRGVFGFQSVQQHSQN